MGSEMCIRDRQVGERAADDLKGGKLMEQNIAFERCVDFLTCMIEKYGDELLREIKTLKKQMKNRKKQVNQS